MKVSKLVATLFGAALLLSASAFAQEVNKSALHLSQSVNAQGKSLQAGNYTVEWSGNGPDVQVTILQGKQTVATLSGHVTDQPIPNRDDAYGTNQGPNGSVSLNAIYPAHKKVVLEFDQSAHVSQGAN